LPRRMRRRGEKKKKNKNKKPTKRKKKKKKETVFDDGGRREMSSCILRLGERGKDMLRLRKKPLKEPGWKRFLKGNDCNTIYRKKEMLSDLHRKRRNYTDQFQKEREESPLTENS